MHNTGSSRWFQRLWVDCLSFNRLTPSGLRGRHITSWDDYNTSSSDSSNQLDNALKPINVLKYPCKKQLGWFQILFLWKTSLFCPVINRWNRIPCRYRSIPHFRGPWKWRLIVSKRAMHIGLFNSLLMNLSRRKRNLNTTAKRLPYTRANFLRTIV